MDGTIIGQGSFNAQYFGANPNPGNIAVQAASPIIIQIPSNADWMKVYNYTQAGTNGNNGIYFNSVANAYTGFEYYWQRGMALGTGMVKYKANGASTVEQDTMVTGGFTLYDPSGQSGTAAAPALGTAIPITTSVTNAVRPVITVNNTAGVSVGSVIRLANTTLTSLNGVDFVVGAIVVNTSITLLTVENELANNPGGGNSGAVGTYRLVNTDRLFYPRQRVITNITQGAAPIVSTSSPHGLTAGQEVRFYIPQVCGMTQLSYDAPGQIYNGATIITSIIDDYDFTININTTGFNAFTYPTTAQQPSSFAIVTPFGEDTATSLASMTIQVPSINGVQIPNTNTQILADSTVNTGYLGMILGGGGDGLALTTPIAGPGGTVTFSALNAISATDLIYWVAGKSSYGGL